MLTLKGVAPKRTPSVPITIHEDLAAEERARSVLQRRFFHAVDPGGYMKRSSIPIGKGDQKYVRYTEDAYMAMCTLDNHCFIVVADGHGRTHQFSQLVTRQTAVLYPMCLSKANGVASVAAIALCEQLHKVVTKELHLREGGTTFSLLDIDLATNMATLATLGDSPILILRQAVNGWSVLTSSEDHDANSPKEQQRIRSMLPPKSTIVFAPARPGETTLYLKNGRNMVMPVRGFGDTGMDVPVGVIGRVPEVKSCLLREGDLCIVASDGLYLAYDPTTNELAGNRRIRDVEVADAVGEYLRQPGNPPLSDLPRFLIDDCIQKLVRSNMIHFGSTRSEADDWAHSNTDNFVVCVFRASSDYSPE